MTGVNTSEVSSTFTEGMLHSSPHNGLDLTLKVEGMKCTSCAALIEKELDTIPGVVEGAVSFFTDTARVRYLPEAANPRQIVEKINNLGYRAFPLEEHS